MEPLKHIAQTCLMLRTRSAARRVTRLYEDAFAQLNLTGGQFSILVAAALRPEVAISPLAEGLGMDRTTLSRALGPLERRGLVRLEKDPDDSRSRRVSITPEGDALLKRAVPLWREAQTRLEASLTDLDPNALRAGLDQLRPP